MRETVSSSHRRTKSSARRGLLGAALLAVALVALEQVLEARDKAAATAGASFALVGGRRVRYLLTGTSHPGPTIVLLTGMTASIEQWDDVQQALSARARVLSYDRAGTGYSDLSTAHDAMAEADELAAVIAATGTEGGCVVVGYSASAFLARVFAVRYPKLTSGVALIDPSSRDDHKAAPPYRAVTYRRDFARYLLTTSTRALFGLERAKQAIEDWNTPASTPAEARARMVLVSFHHWFAVTWDAFLLDRSSKQAVALTPVASIPASVLSTAMDPQTFLQQKDIAASFRATLHTTTTDHQHLLREGGDSQTVDTILEVEQRVRESMAH